MEERKYPQKPAPKVDTTSALAQSEMLRASNFEVTFIPQSGTILSVTDGKVLSECINDIEPGLITFQIGLDKENRIMPLDLLFKLVSEDCNCDVVVNMFNKTGDIYAKIAYHNCKFEFDDLHKLTKLSYHNYDAFGIDFDDTLKSLGLSFTYRKVSLQTNETTHNITDLV